MHKNLLRDERKRTEHQETERYQARSQNNFHDASQELFGDSLEYPIAVQFQCIVQQQAAQALNQDGTHNATDTVGRADGAAHVKLAKSGPCAEEANHPFIETSARQHCDFPKRLSAVEFETSGAG